MFTFFFSSKGITKYINHLDDSHPNEEKIPCPACPSLFENIKNLKIHVMEHVPNNNTETNRNGNDRKNTENNVINPDSSFDFDQIEEDSDVSDMDDEAFLEDMDMDDDYDDLDDEDFSIVQQKTIKPAPKNTVSQNICKKVQFLGKFLPQNSKHSRSEN